jgi:signal peptidase I
VTPEADATESTTDASNPHTPDPDATAAAGADAPADALADASADAPSDDGARPPSLFTDIVVMVLVAVALVIVVKGFFFQTFYIPSGSMEKTLVCDDRVLVWRQPFLVGEVNRGDVLVFHNWDETGSDVPTPGVFRYVVNAVRNGIGFGLGPYQEQDLIKRVIGLPGDEIEVRDNRALVNGDPLDEPYVFVSDDGIGAAADFGPVTVPDGKFFMMGDHRDESADSRKGGGTFLDADAVVGRAIVRFWPPSRWGGLSGPPAGDPDPKLCPR